MLNMVQDEGLVAGTARHNKGCNCKKSGCLKKYCECFQAGIYCGDNCKCIDCKNFEVAHCGLLACMSDCVTARTLRYCTLDCLLACQAV